MEVLHKSTCTCTWYCGKCGTQNSKTIEALIPVYFDTKLDKQIIVNQRCIKCGQEFVLFKNRKEIVQVSQRIVPETVIKEEDINDGV